MSNMQESSYDLANEDEKFSAEHMRGMNRYGQLEKVPLIQQNSCWLTYPNVQVIWKSPHKPTNRHENFPARQMRSLLRLLIAQQSQLLRVCNQYGKERYVGLEKPKSYKFNNIPDIRLGRHEKPDSHKSKNVLNLCH